MTDPRSTRRWKTLTRFIYERDGRECVTCGTDEDLTVDHIIPVSMGDEELWYDPENLRVMCRSHNSQKGNKTQGQVSDWINPTWLAWEKEKQ